VGEERKGEEGGKREKGRKAAASVLCLQSSLSSESEKREGGKGRGEMKKGGRGKGRKGSDLFLPDGREKRGKKGGEEREGGESIDH